MPLLERVHPGRDDLDEARRRLIAWDRRVSADSPVATLYVYWEEALLRKLAERRVPLPLLDGYLARAHLDVTTLTRPSRAWFDRDPEKSRDVLLADALASAVDRVRVQAGIPGRTDLGTAARRHVQAPAGADGSGETPL